MTTPSKLLKTKAKKEKVTHLPTFETKFNCLSCQQIYRTASISKQNIGTSSCANCVNPEIPSRRVKTTEIEKFLQRIKKGEEIRRNKANN